MVFSFRNFFSRVFFATLCVVLSSSAQAGKSVSYEQGEAPNFPEGCGSPIQDVAQFMDFFESSASMMVAKYGTQASGAVDLFAVLSLREQFFELSRSFSESPIDRLVIAQLCQFQKIRAQDQVKQMKVLPISAADPDLLNHLARVSSQLLSDSRLIVRDAIKQRAQQLQQKSVLVHKQEDIKAARLAGERKAKALISD